MEDRSTQVAWMAAMGLVQAMAFCSFYGDLRHDAVSYAIASGAATLVLSFAFLLFRTRKEFILRRRDILLVALCLRLLAFPMMPTLSDDAWRYLWDGRLLANGINPYHHLPVDSALIDYRDRLYQRQGYPETNTIYPPVAQLIFAAAVAPASSPGVDADPVILYLFYKLLLIAVDLASIGLLLELLKKLERPASAAILYAWHPLVVVELAGQGHTDVFWVFAVALALYGYLFRRSGEGLPGLAFGVGVRLFPVLAMPVWFRFIERKRRVGAILLSLPFLLMLYPLFDPEAFARYSTVAARFTNYYEFNGGVYFGIKWILDELHIVPSNVIAGGVVTGLMLLGVGVITLWPVRERRFSALHARVLGIVTLQITLSAKVHIWYFVLPLYLLAVLPDRRFLFAWMWAALIAPLTYLYYADEPFREHGWVLWLEWGGMAALLVAGAIMAQGGKRREKKEAEDRTDGERNKNEERPAPD